MSELNRRATDRGLDPWFNEKEIIENRIMVAKPGDEVRLREDDLDRPYDRVQDLTWNDVLDILFAQGVIDRVDVNRNIVKKDEEGFGVRPEPGVAKQSLQGIVDESRKNWLRTLDISFEGDMNDFISWKLNYFINTDDSHSDHMQQLSAHLPEITPIIVSGFLSMLPIRVYQSSSDPVTNAVCEHLGERGEALRVTISWILNNIGNDLLSHPKNREMKAD